MFLVLLSDLCKGMCYLGNAQLWVASQHMPPSTTTSSLKKSRPWSRNIVGATAKSAAAKPKASPKPRTSNAYVHAGGTQRRSRGTAREATKRQYAQAAKQQLAQQGSCLKQ